MKPKKDNGVVHGVDCKNLGNRYASLVLKNASVKVTDLPLLKTHSVYNVLKPEEQKTVRNNIRFVAKDLLIQAGLAPETVARVLESE